MVNTIFAKMYQTAADDLPGFDNGFKDYAQEQVGIFILIVVIGLMAFFLVKQAWGRLLGTLVIGGIVFFVVGSPESTLETIGNIAKSIIGG